MKLTDISSAPDIKKTHLVHVVDPTDNTQDPAGSSYNSELETIFSAIEHRTLYTIPVGKTIDIDSNEIYVVYGNLKNEGTINNLGKLVVINGAFQNLGTYNDGGVGIYQNVDLLNPANTKTINGNSIVGSGDIVVGGGGFSVTNITYSALKLLYDSNAMVPGFYSITDFTTIYDQPDFDALGVPKGTVTTKTASAESIIVLATSATSLHNIAFSLDFPNDVINYDITFDATEIMAAPAKGRITYRKDNENNLSAPYDFRNVLFKRYEQIIGFGAPFTEYKDNTGASNEALTFAVGCKNIEIGVYDAPLGGWFILPNNVFIGAASTGFKTGLNFANNTIIQDAINVQFGNDCKGNRINLLNDVTFGNGSFDNIIGQLTNSEIGKIDACVIGQSNSRFKIGECSGLTIGTFNSYVEMSDDCTGTIGNNNQSLKFGINCTLNIGDLNLRFEIGENSSVTVINSNTDLVVGHGNTINFGNLNVANTFGFGNTITFGDSNARNTIENSNTNIVFGNSNARNKLGSQKGGVGGVTFGNSNLGNVMGNFGNTITVGNSNFNNITGNSVTFIVGNSNTENIIGEQTLINFGSGNYRNKIGPHHNVTFIDSNFGNEFDINTTASHRIVTGGSGNSHNKFGKASALNTIILGDNNMGNIVGDFNLEIRFDNGCVYNTIGSNNTSVKTSSIVAQFSYCKIGNGNTIFATSGLNDYNEIGDSCNITMNFGNQNNKIGNSCSLNFNNDCKANAFGNNCSGNLLSNAKNNIFGNYITIPSLAAATHVFGDYECQIFKRLDLTQRLSYFDNTDTLNVANVNA